MIRCAAFLPALAWLAACSSHTSGAAANEVETSRGGAENVAAEFVRLSGNDPWARPPSAWPEHLVERPCVRVSDALRAESIRQLERESVLPISAGDYRRLTGRRQTPLGTPYLLRGFATDRSITRVMTGARIVVVESNSLGGLFRMRRHPCIAMLDQLPLEVFTYANYDM